MENYCWTKTSFVDRVTHIGEFTKIGHFCNILRGAKIGKNVLIGHNCFIDEGVIIGDNCEIENGVQIVSGVNIGNNVFIGANCVFTNIWYNRAKTEQSKKRTEVEDYVSIGPNSTILCGLTIGKLAVIGIGTTVVENVDPYCIIYEKIKYQKKYLNRGNQ